jgi:nuclear pore complex protein Nup160
MLHFLPEVSLHLVSNISLIHVFTCPELFLPPSLIVLRLAQSNRFDMAMATASSLKVDMTELFAHLTNQCLRLSRNPDDVM